MLSIAPGLSCHDINILLLLLDAYRLCSTLRALYDDASSVDYQAVEKIIRKELGKEVNEVFRTFSKIPVAAASIAQVHKATLLDGTVVAVKVQKPEIQVQIEWDLIAYRWLIKAYEYIFELPMSFAVDYTTKHLREETDFLNEARNSELCNEFLQTDAKLRHEAYVPKIFHEYSTKQVMVAEWVDGVRATDKAAIQQMGLNVTKVMESVVDVFAHQIFVSGFVHCDPHPGNVLVRKHPSNPKKHQLVKKKSRTFYKLLCIAVKKTVLLTSYTTFFATCLNSSCWITDCICGSRTSSGNNTAYFGNHSFCWIKSLSRRSVTDGALTTHKCLVCTFFFIAFAKRQIGPILITDVKKNIANATLLKPYNMNLSPSITPTTNTSVLDAYEIQMKLKTSLKEFLINSELLPKELIFIGRNMTIVRANNKTLGSPVNRINRMARWAVVGLGHDMNLWTSRSTGDLLSGNSSYAVSRNMRLGFWKALSSTLQASFNYWMFEAALALMSFAYHFAQFKSYLERTILGKQSAGFEAVLDDALKQKLEQEYGIKIEGDLFDA